MRPATAAASDKPTMAKRPISGARGKYWDGVANASLPS